ncbi:SDR family oxidoreductase, partial [Acinetobacter baumannii]
NHDNTCVTGNRGGSQGRKRLIVGIANDQSIAWGSARAFRAFGADLAVTYPNEQAKRHGV